MTKRRGRIRIKLSFLREVEMPKTFLAGTALLVGLLAASAQAETTRSPGATPENVCLRTIDIDRTTVPDDKTILFHMKDGRVWRNALVTNCPLLGVHGFAYSPTPDNEICGSLQSIRVLDSGSICMLGPFTQEPPGGKR
jgi:hypothetical protein